MNELNLIDYTPGQPPTVRWTWLPFWLGANKSLVAMLDHELAELYAFHASTGQPMEHGEYHAWLCERLAKQFPVFNGLSAVLKSISGISQA